MEHLTICLQEELKSWYFDSESTMFLQTKLQRIEYWHVLKTRICPDSQNHASKLGVSLVDIKFLFMNTAFALLFCIVLKTFSIKTPTFVIVGKQN